jgi:hypothetical protein
LMAGVCIASAALSSGWDGMVRATFSAHGGAGADRWLSDSS